MNESQVRIALERLQRGSKAYFAKYVRACRTNKKSYPAGLIEGTTVQTLGLGTYADEEITIPPDVRTTVKQVTVIIATKYLIKKAK